MRLTVIIGERFGHLVVTADAGLTDAYVRMVAVRCDCGEERERSLSVLKAGCATGRAPVCSKSCPLFGHKNRTLRRKKYWKRHGHLWSREDLDHIERDISAGMAREFGRARVSYNGPTRAAEISVNCVRIPTPTFSAEAVALGYGAKVGPGAVPFSPRATGSVEIATRKICGGCGQIAERHARGCPRAERKTA